MQKSPINRPIETSNEIEVIISGVAEKSSLDHWLAMVTEPKGNENGGLELGKIENKQEKWLSFCIFP